MLAQLRVRNFRNLAAQEVSVGAGRQLILGANGAGKTSLLEAVYLLATTRSFRTPQLADCCRHGADVFAVEGEVEDDRRARLFLGWQRGAGRSRTVDGGRTRLAEHLAVLPVLAWTSADAQVLVGAPGERRRLLDRGLVGLAPASIEVFARYRQALHAKRRLLLRGDASADELAPWNRLLAAAAAEIIRRRRDYVERLEGALGEVAESFELGFPAVSLAYRPSPAEGLDGEEAIARVLASLASRERRRQQSLAGPHRDDLLLRLGGHDVRRVASAGERKALGLILLAAQARVQTATGRAPLLLLDDVDTELDAHRLASLWPMLAAGDQVLASSNRPGVWAELEIDHRFRCAGGVVTDGGS